MAAKNEKRKRTPKTWSWSDHDDWYCTVEEKTVFLNNHSANVTLSLLHVRDGKNEMPRKKVFAPPPPPPPGKPLEICGKCNKQAAVVAWDGCSPSDFAWLINPSNESARPLMGPISQVPLTNRLRPKKDCYDIDAWIKFSLNKYEAWQFLEQLTYKKQVLLIIVLKGSTWNCYQILILPMPWTLRSIVLITKSC